MYRALRPLLFALPPESAHTAALLGLRALGAWPARRQTAGASVEVQGLRFPNRVGVAAGLDKDAIAVTGLARLGFGFVEVGTVTPQPQVGNPKPRLFRLTQDRAIVNRMGFNSAGVDRLVANLRRHRSRTCIPVGVNIGKNLHTPIANAVSDYRACLEAVYDWADYVTVNLSSPNTPGLRTLQAASAAHALVAELAALRDRLSRARGAAAKPLFVKVAPDLAPADLEATATAVLEAGANGLVAVNTTFARPDTLRSRYAAEQGGLSGKPLFPKALDTIGRLRQRIGADAVLIAVGGIDCPADVQAMLRAGADLVQVYSALVYEGPSLARRLAA